MSNLTCLALINTSAKYPDQDSELGELIDSAEDIIVVLDLDRVGEALVTSAIDGEYAEPLPDQLAPRINAWARHQRDDTQAKVDRIVAALRSAHDLAGDSPLVGKQVTSAYEKVLDAVMYGHPEAVLEGWPADQASESICAPGAIERLAQRTNARGETPAEQAMREADEQLSSS